MAVAFAEGQVTKLRREFKLLLPPEEAGRLCRRLLGELQCPPAPATEVTSIYFDRPGSPLAARALRAPDDCVKVRTKEYFPDQGAEAGPRVVLEIKRERGGMTQKRRVWLPRPRLRAALRGQEPAPLPQLWRGGLLPVAAVTYRREVYQRSEAWRVTVDREVAFYPVGEAVALSAERVGPNALGPPAAREGRVVVEVKHIGQPLAPWLSDLAHREAQRRYSKFVEAMSRLRSLGTEEVQGG